jgi:hypothetical protein
MSKIKAFGRKPLVAYLLAIVRPVRSQQSRVRHWTAIAVGLSPLAATALAAIRTDAWKATVVGLVVLALVQVYVGHGLMVRLAAETLPMSVTAGLEPTPEAIEYLTLDVAYGGESAELRVEVTWDQFPAYGPYRPIWLPDLSDALKMGPERPKAKLRVLELAEGSDGAAHLIPVVMPGSFAGHTKNSSEGLDLRVTFTRHNPPGRYAVLVATGPDRSWKCREATE